MTARRSQQAVEAMACTRRVRREQVEASAAELSPPPSSVGSPVLLGGVFGRYVPVSFVAKHWGVSSRRVRTLLDAGRLYGKKRENGFWEVFYPYQFSVGTRGHLMRMRPPLQAFQWVETVGMEPGMITENRRGCFRKFRDRAKLGMVFFLKTDESVLQGTDIAMENSLPPYTLYEVSYKGSVRSGASPPRRRETAKSAHRCVS